MMPDWNVVITLQPEGYGDTLHVLREFGEIAKSPYRDVLVMHIDIDAHEFLEKLRDLLATDKTLVNSAARIMPVTKKFTFSSPDEFRAKAREAVHPWADELAGKSFHVRVHRRGLHRDLMSQTEERAVGQYLVEHVEARGKSTRVDFDDPDVVIDIETIDREAGVAVWSRDDRERFELLRPD